MTYDAANEAYRIYARRGSTLSLIATCATPEALGVALVTFYREDEFEKATVGIMFKPDPDQSGEWIANPYGATRKRRFPLSGDAAQPTQADT